MGGNARRVECEAGQECEQRSGHGGVTGISGQDNEG